MSVKYTFSCDLCRVIYQRGDGKLIPVLWKFSIGSNREVLGIAASWAGVERHLCVKCITDVAEIAKAALPK